MAIKISQIATTKTVLTGAEQIEINDAGVTKKTTPQAIADMAISPYLNGRQFIYSGGISGYGSTQFGVDLGAWPGLSTTAGSLQTPVYSTLNKVTVIPREVKRGLAGVANDVGWSLGVASANPNSVLFPGTAGDSGFEISLIGGIDSPNMATLSTTEFLFGIAISGSGVPINGAALSSSAPQWFGLYSDNGSTDFFVGYKLASGSIIPLTSALSLTWAAYQAWRIVINVSPSGVTTWTLQEASGIGTWATVSSGSTSAFQPGRVPFAPNWRLHKNGASDVQDLWIISVLIRAFFLGSFSL